MSGNAAASGLVWRERVDFIARKRTKVKLYSDTTATRHDSNTPCMTKMRDIRMCMKEQKMCIRKRA
jgi:hypothetical protein